MTARGITVFFLLVLLASAFSASAGEKHAAPPEWREVDIAGLKAEIARADTITVTPDPYSAMVLYRSADRKDIAGFAEALQLAQPEPGTGFHCMCVGSPAIRLYRGETELVLITNHHGKSVRASLWSSDVMLQDVERWLQWFDERGIAGPRREAEEAAERAKRSEMAYSRWLTAMPSCLRPFWRPDINWGRPQDAEPLRKALSEAISDPRERAQALFAWYGSGMGPWSGFPAYEEGAENLLLDLSVPVLIAAAEDPALTGAQLEGAARLFGGWYFYKRHGRPVLPEALRQKLLEHSLKSSDTDRTERAKRAFAPE